jgi:chromosomal replication initiation ATPase DnaA
MNTDAKTAADIINIVAASFELKPAEITGNSQDGRLSLARHLAIMIIYNKTEFTHADISVIFGKKVTSTVSKSISAARRAMETNLMINDVMEKIQPTIKL